MKTALILITSIWRSDIREMHDPAFIDGPENPWRLLLDCRRGRSRRRRERNGRRRNGRGYHGRPRGNGRRSLLIDRSNFPDVVCRFGNRGNTSKPRDEILARVVRRQRKIEVSVELLEEELQILHSTLDILLRIEEIPHAVSSAG